MGKVEINNIGGDTIFSPSSDIYAFEQIFFFFVRFFLLYGVKILIGSFCDKYYSLLYMKGVPL